MKLSRKTKDIILKYASIIVIGIVFGSMILSIFLLIIFGITYEEMSGFGVYSFLILAIALSAAECFGLWTRKLRKR